MNHQEYSPKEVDFEVQVDSKKIELTFRPFTGRDELNWKNKGINQKVMEEYVTGFLTGEDSTPFYKLLFRQLTAESRELIKSIKVTDVDDDGNEITLEEVTPVEKFIYCMYGHQTKIEVFQKFLECRGLSLPKLKEHYAEELKKKMSQK